VANLSKTLHINFYQNRLSIVEVKIKKFWCVLYAPQCSTAIIECNTRKGQQKTSLKQKKTGSQCNWFHPIP